MHVEYIQHLRHKLQKRFRRLNSAGHQTFHVMLKQFMAFIYTQPVFIGIFEDLEHRNPAASKNADRILNKEALCGENEDEHAGISLHVIKKCITLDDPHVEMNIAARYRVFETAERLDFFRETFVEPIYEYLDEQLDDQRAILALLRRYKHKSEWFQREVLYDLWEKNTGSGEKSLAYHLYEYLHDQGIDFSIEPTSASGKPDLISAQDSKDPLIADAKIFCPEKGKDKSYLAKGFNQIYQYTLDYNQPFGYMIIFKTSPDDLKFVLPEQEQSTPFLVHNHKTIYFMTIDIYPHEKSASQRGVLKTMEITVDDLVRQSSDQ